MDFCKVLLADQDIENLIIKCTGNHVFLIVSVVLLFGIQEGVHGENKIHKN